MHLRNKIYARLRNRGFSPAQGIFECDFTQSDLTHMRKFLKSSSFADNDCVILYPLCSVCQDNRQFFGAANDNVAGDEPWLVF